MKLEHILDLLDRAVKFFNAETIPPHISAIPQVSIKKEDELSKIFADMKLTKDADIYDFAAQNDLQAFEGAFVSMQPDNINSQNKHGQTLLRLAAHNNCLNVAKFLCENGANINAKDGAGFTPLHWAASKGNIEVVEYLYNRGADASIKSNGGDSPFLQAVYNGYDSVVKFLHEYEVSSKVNKKAFLGWIEEFAHSETTPPRNHSEIEAYLQGEGLFDQ